MSIKKHILIWFPFLLLVTVAFYLSNGPVEYLWLHAPGWSRGRLIGQTQLNQAVPVAIDDAGNIYIFLIQTDGTIKHPLIMAYDRQLQEQWTHTLDIPLDEPDNPQILWDGQQLRLFWLDQQRLYTAQLGLSGNVQGSPRQISEEAKVASYNVVPDVNGNVVIFYGGSRREPGIYALFEDNIDYKAVHIDADGVEPILYSDHLGNLYVSWAVYPQQGNPRLYYTVYSGANTDGRYTPGQTMLLHEIEIPRSDTTLRGYRFGLDQDYGYLLWTEEAKSGRAIGLHTNYLYFPLDEPTMIAEFGSISVPYSRDIVYETLSPSPYRLEIGPRALISGQTGRSVTPLEIAINPTIESELVVAIRAQVAYLQNEEASQIVLLFLHNGPPHEYQLLSFTSNASFSPTVFTDKEKQLYVSWLERNEISGFNVYFTSTAPEIQRSLNKLTQADVGRMTLQVIFGLLQGLAFAPFAVLLWLIVPLLILAATWITRRGKESLSNRATLTSLALALAAYWAAKLNTLTPAFNYVPFSAWIPIIPTWLEIPLQLGVPILITLMAFRMAGYLTQRSTTHSATLFLIIYAGIDGIFTMAIYGGLLYDAF